MAWEVRITNEAKKSIAKIGSEMHGQIIAGIRKVSRAPLPKPDGYGKPLGKM